MGLNDEEREIIVSLELEKARKIYGQIGALSRLGYWDNVTNRLYYALFHAVSALLIHDKHRVGTHKGIVATMGQYYIKTGILLPADGRLYSSLQTMREMSDYNYTFEATGEEITPKIMQAKALIDKIETLIKQDIGECKSDE